MQNYLRLESYILEDATEGLIIIPVYLSNKNNPLMDAFIRDFYPDKKEEIKAQHESGDVVICSTNKDDTTEYWLCYLMEGNENLMKLVLRERIRKAVKTKYQEISFALFATSEFGFDETGGITFQENLLLEAANKYKDKNFNFYVTPTDYRSQNGPHMGDGIVPEDVQADEEYPDQASHHTVAVSVGKVKSYRDYFAQYIELRNAAGWPIRQNDDTYNLATIKGLGDTIATLLPERKNSGPYPMSKWAKEQKGKDGKTYYPKPSKQFLKFIILILDMSYDEAISCLNFFGYGLARFDKEDRAYEYMLKKWEKPIDVRAANQTLIKRYGKKAAIAVMKD